MNKEMDSKENDDDVPNPATPNNCAKKENFAKFGDCQRKDEDKCDSR